MRSGEYYARGKILLSGEYLVMFGAKALSVPVKFGQRMHVMESPLGGIISWETSVLNKLWFKASFRTGDFKVIESSNEKTALFIQNLLREGAALHSDFFATGKGCRVNNTIDFSMEWGLGSSSSLVSNLATWIDIDLYTYYQRVFNGSGYDVFSARADRPITFQLKDTQPEIKETVLHPSITNKLYFVYLGNKKDSQISVGEFRAKYIPDPLIVRKVTQLTDAMITTTSASDFFSMMHEHENILAGILKQPVIKEEQFPDFNGAIKSLGAWGGDFIMAGSHQKPDKVEDYFLKYNHPVIFRWDEIVLE